MELNFKKAEAFSQNLSLMNTLAESTQNAFLYPNSSLQSWITYTFNIKTLVQQNNAKNRLLSTFWHKGRTVIGSCECVLERECMCKHGVPFSWLKTMALLDRGRRPSEKLAACLLAQNSPTVVDKKDFGFFVPVSCFSVFSSWIFCSLLAAFPVIEAVFFRHGFLLLLLPD